MLSGTENDILTGGDADDQAYGETGDDRAIWNPGDDTEPGRGRRPRVEHVQEVDGHARQFTATANEHVPGSTELNPHPSLSTSAPREPRPQR